MGTELVPETLYSNELTRLCARENYMEGQYINYMKKLVKNCYVIIHYTSKDYNVIDQYLLLKNSSNE